MLGLTWKPSVLQPLQHVPVRASAASAAVLPAELVPERIERARRRDLRIELADGAGGGVARAGEERPPALRRARALSFSKPLFVMKISPRTSKARRHLRPCRRCGIERIVRTFGGDVLAARAVAARRGRRERAVLVHERAGEAVDLRLADHREVVALDDVGGALVPGAKLSPSKRVRERQQRHAVLDDAERLDGRAADALRRRVRRDQLRMPRLELAQLLHELVERGVGDLR